MCLVQLYERRLIGSYDIYFSLTCGLKKGKILTLSLRKMLLLDHQIKLNIRFLSLFLSLQA